MTTQQSVTGAPPVISPQEYDFVVEKLEGIKAHICQCSISVFILIVNPSKDALVYADLFRAILEECTQTDTRTFPHFELFHFEAVECKPV